MGLRRCSWRLTSLRDEAVKVEEVGGVPLNGVRLDEASDLLSKASAKLLKLSEMVDKAIDLQPVFQVSLNGIVGYKALQKRQHEA